MFLHCDNYATCGGTTWIRDTEKATDDHARAKGWHIWRGETLSGQYQEVRLCPTCVGRNRRPDRHLPPLLPGDQTMIQFEVEVNEPADQ